MLSLSRTAHIGQVYTYGSYCLYEMYQKKVRESKFLGVVGRDVWMQVRYFLIPSFKVFSLTEKLSHLITALSF
jgi:hypothetical protein